MTRRVVREVVRGQPTFAPHYDMVALRDIGYTNAMIAEHLGVSRVTVHKKIGPQPPIDSLRALRLRYLDDGKTAAEKDFRSGLDARSYLDREKHFNPLWWQGYDSRMAELAGSRPSNSGIPLESYGTT